MPGQVTSPTLVKPRLLTRSLVAIRVNKYLQAYHMYRVEALSRPEVRRLDTMSRDAALATLQKPEEFPFGVPA